MTHSQKAAKAIETALEISSAWSYPIRTAVEDARPTSLGNTVDKLCWLVMVCSRKTPHEYPVDTAMRLRRWLLDYHHRFGTIPTRAALMRPQAPESEPDAEPHQSAHRPPQAPDATARPISGPTPVLTEPQKARLDSLTPAQRVQLDMVLGLAAQGITPTDTELRTALHTMAHLIGHPLARKIAERNELERMRD